MEKIILAIMGILSMLYGVFVLLAGSGTSFWMVWEAIGVFFIFWALLSYKKFFDTHKKIRNIFYAMIGVVAAVLVILSSMIAGEFAAKGKEDLDYIIVLGAQVRENGPSVVLRYRLDTAIDYLNENPETICIVSGGQGMNEPFSEAEGMYRYLLQNGIEKKRILLEDESTNTVQNIQNSKKLMKVPYNGVGIVSNNFHVFRAVRIAKAQGLEGACGIAADSNVLYIPSNVLRECCGILKDWMMNNI